MCIVPILLRFPEQTFLGQHASDEAWQGSNPNGLDVVCLSDMVLLDMLGQQQIGLNLVGRILVTTHRRLVWTGFGDFGRSVW